MSSSNEVEHRHSNGYIAAVAGALVTVAASTALIVSNMVEGPPVFGLEGGQVSAGPWWTYMEPGDWDVQESSANSITLLLPDDGVVTVTVMPYAEATLRDLREQANATLSDFEDESDDEIAFITESEAEAVLAEGDSYSVVAYESDDDEVAWVAVYKHGSEGSSEDFRQAFMKTVRPSPQVTQQP